ncbi:MAG: hypothetical protein HKN03_12290 [Acidimicrobiales bacterium]|nr:hypothetical protein [Acidimicrobiales bacterium]
MATSTPGPDSGSNDERLRRPSADFGGRRTIAENLRSWLNLISRRQVIACIAAGGVAVVTASVVQSAREQAASWGGVTPVLVATEVIGSGAEVGSHNSVLRSLPLAVLPAEPLSILDEPTFAATTISDGQILTRLAISGDRDGLEEQARAVTLPLPLAPPAVDPGDLVEIFGVSAQSTGAQAEVLVERARVVAMTENGITVVVARHEVSELLRALAIGSVEFARRPPYG